MGKTSLYSDDSIKSVSVLGDWHADRDYAIRQLRTLEGTSNVYFQVGDFGIFPFSLFGDFVRDIETELAKQDRELWFIDGNHEKFPLFENFPFEERGLRKVTDHIYYVPRGYAWLWGRKRFLALGGAVSIDRGYRTLGFDYFVEEEITENDLCNLEQGVDALGGRTDVLFTHDTANLPYLIPPRSFGADIDKDAKKGRESVERAIVMSNPKLTVHGHYHVAYMRSYPTGLTVVGLGDNTGPLDKNHVLIETKNL